MDATKRRRDEPSADAPGAASASDRVVLHSYWRSSCSWRVRIGLAFKGIEYDYVPVHLLKDGGEQLKLEYTSKFNSGGLVPALEIDGVTLQQSAAILEYLEERAPTPALLPAAAITRARVRTIMNMIGSDIQPVQNLRVLKRVMALEKAHGGDADATKMEWGKFTIEHGFKAVEAAITEHGGKYCVGDDITMADLYLVPQVYNAVRFGVDMTQFPRIAAIDAALADHPAFKAAHPAQQPDAQA